MELNITTILTAEKQRTALITNNQSDEVDTLLDTMDFLVGTLPFKAVPQQYQMRMCYDMNLREDFLESRCYADAFGMAASFTKEYVLKNRKRRDRKTGLFTRSTHNMPEWGEYQKHFAGSVEFWSSRCSDAQRAQDQVTSGILGGIDNALKTNTESRDTHWHSCLETIVDGLKEAGGNLDILTKTKGQTDALVKRYLDKKVADYAVVRNFLNECAEDDAFAAIVEMEAKMPIYSEDKGEESVMALIEFNLKEITDALEGWELSDMQEEGDEIGLTEPEQMTELEFTDQVV